MKKYLLSFGVLAAAALSMTSCLSNSSSDQKYTFGYGNTDCFNRVFDMETQEYTITDKPSYSFVYNLTKGQLDVDMSNIKLGDSGYGGMSFKLTDLTFKEASDAFWVTTASDVIPYGTAQSYIFDSFNLRALPGRVYGGRGIPVYYMNYVVNGRYRVTVYPTQFVYFGSINATDLDNQKIFTLANDGETYYAVQIDPEKMKAKLIVSGAKYKEGMSRYNFLTQDFPVELTNTGYIIRTELDKEYPVYNEKSSTKPVEDQSIKNITIVGTLETGANINFTCDLGDDGKFGVNASMRYLFYDKQQPDKQ